MNKSELSSMSVPDLKDYLYGLDSDVSTSTSKLTKPQLVELVWQTQKLTLGQVQQTQQAQQAQDIDWTQGTQWREGPMVPRVIGQEVDFSSLPLSMQRKIMDKQYQESLAMDIEKERLRAIQRQERQKRQRLQRQELQKRQRQQRQERQMIESRANMARDQRASFLASKYASEGASVAAKLRQTSQLAEKQRLEKIKQSEEQKKRQLAQQRERARQARLARYA
jgi:hypothetical protein